MSVVITGGAGFIGINVADDHLNRGDGVVVLDDFSRAGSRANLEWLQDRHRHGLTVMEVDIRNSEKTEAAIAASGDVERVYHLAAQVAVTTSVRDPRTDFEINALGTFNVLEAVRARAPEAFVIYASTNKVYGGMEDLPTAEDTTRYRFRDQDGIAEDQPLDFHSPYGCSKGAGDQYVRDYARIFGLQTVVMRQSCIYGRRQMGVEDQGWVAHFCISTHKNRPITIYGDGKQVRDLLWIEDLIAAYHAAAEYPEISSGQVYNIGGGPENTLSIWIEFGAILEELTDRKIDVNWSEWRPGDQPVYVSSIAKAERDLGWRPKVAPGEGIAMLWDWVGANLPIFD